MKRPKLLLIGGGGHCRSCIDVIEQEGKFEIAGVIDKQDQNGDTILGYPVLGNDEDLAKLRSAFQHCLVTVGFIISSRIRLRLCEKVKSLGFISPVIISPNAYVSKHTYIGEGTIVMHHAVVNAGARVGEYCILNTKSIVEHDVVVDSYTHISTSAVVNGGAAIGARCFVGSNSSVVQGVSIPDDYFFRANQLIASEKDGYSVAGA